MINSQVRIRVSLKTMLHLQMGRQICDELYNYVSWCVLATDERAFLAKTKYSKWQAWTSKNMLDNILFSSWLHYTWPVLTMLCTIYRKWRSPVAESVTSESTFSGIHKLMVRMIHVWAPNFLPYSLHSFSYCNCLWIVYKSHVKFRTKPSSRCMPGSRCNLESMSDMVFTKKPTYFVSKQQICCGCSTLLSSMLQEKVFAHDVHPQNQNRFAASSP